MRGKLLFGSLAALAAIWSCQASAYDGAADDIVLSCKVWPQETSKNSSSDELSVVAFQFSSGIRDRLAPVTLYDPNGFFGGHQLFALADAKGFGIGYSPAADSLFISISQIDGRPKQYTAIMQPRGSQLSSERYLGGCALAVVPAGDQTIMNDVKTWPIKSKETEGK